MRNTTPQPYQEMSGCEMLRRNQMYCQGSLAFSSTNTLRHNLEDSDGTYTDNDSISSDDEIFVHPPRIKQRQRSQNEPLSLAGNDALLLDISECIYQCWKEVGRHLLMNESLIDNIDIDHHHEGEKEKAYQLLVKWSRRMPIRATVKNLQNVLVHIGKKEIADTIPTLYWNYEKLQGRQQVEFKNASTSSERTKTEIEGHIKLQKGAMQELHRNLKFYKKEVKVIKELSSRLLEQEEARELQEQLKELDKLGIEDKLDSLQRQIHDMQQQERSKEWTELDGKLRDVAERLHEVEKTVKQYSDTVDDLRVFEQCSRFGEFLCSFGRILPRRNARSEKRKSVKTEEELEDNVFEYPCQATRPGENHLRHHPQSTSSLPNGNTFNTSSQTRLCHQSLPRKKSSQAYRNAEKHVRRRFGVSSTLSIDEQFQLQEIIDNSRGRLFSQERPFIYSHSCINNFQSHSSPDFSTLPIPCFKSSGAIASLVTKSPTKYDESDYSPSNAGGLLTVQQGFFNVMSDLV